MHIVQNNSGLPDNPIINKAIDMARKICDKTNSSKKPQDTPAFPFYKISLETAKFFYKDSSHTDSDGTLTASAIMCNALTLPPNIRPTNMDFIHTFGETAGNELFLTSEKISLLEINMHKEEQKLSRQEIFDNLSLAQQEIFNANTLAKAKSINEAQDHPWAPERRLLFIQNSKSLVVQCHSYIRDNALSRMCEEMCKTVYNRIKTDQTVDNNTTQRKRKRIINFPLFRRDIAAF